MQSQTVENYLKALFSLANENNEVGISELSEKLEVSKPTANSMVKKLHEDGFVKYEKYKPLVLTEKGKKAAAMVIRKHRLTEMYLVEKMGFGWEEVHSVAEQIEHIKSPMFFDRMDELLNHPAIDPHGSPIPDKNGQIHWKSYNTLADIEVGETVVLKALSLSTKEFLEFLNRKELALNTNIEVEQREPFDESVHLQVNGKAITLSKQICERLLVEAV